MAHYLDRKNILLICMKLKFLFGMLCLFQTSFAAMEQFPQIDMGRVYAVFSSDLSEGEQNATNFFKKNSSSCFSKTQNINSLINSLDIPPYSSSSLLGIGLNAWLFAFKNFKGTEEENRNFAELYASCKFWDILKNPKFKESLVFKIGTKCAASYTAYWLKIANEQLWKSDDKKLFYDCWDGCRRNWLLV